MTGPDLRASFRVPFRAQVAALRLRLGNLVPTAAWDDLWQQEHARAFAVAGALKADLLADLAEAVRAAIEDGETLEAFRARFRGIVERHGWHGWTGEGTRKGENWRTRVIWRTNIATSYAAGRMAQLRQIGYRYWVYKHGGSREPRLQHLGWDGLILPPDHPFWQTHAPPNGWGCSCRIRGAHSLDGAVRKGGKPGLKLPDGWDRPDPRTGAPKGIDRGWGYAVGANTAEQIAGQLAAKTPRLPPPLAADLTEAVTARLAEVGVPSPATPDEAIALGRRVLDRLMKTPVPEAEVDDLLLVGKTLGEVLGDGWLARGGPLLRAAIGRALGELRETGTAQIALASRGAAARSLMTPVARAIPASWVRAANAEKLRVRVSDGRGSYARFDSELPLVTAQAKSAAHEYLHHLQHMLPELEALFQAMHRRRTFGDPLVMIWLGEVARPDAYYDAYQGREYPGFGAKEVLTMALEPLLGRDARHEDQFAKLLDADREMLEFALGVLFFWKPR